MAAVAAWALLVLLYQYDAASLAPYELWFDVLFLISVLGIMLTRAVRRTGVQALFRAAALALALGISLYAAEQAARLSFRRAQSSGDARDFIGRHAQGPSYRRNNLGFRDNDVPAATPTPGGRASKKTSASRT